MSGRKKARHLPISIVNEGAWLPKNGICWIVGMDDKMMQIPVMKMITSPLLPDQTILRTLPRLIAALGCGLSLWFLVTDHYALAQQPDVPWECSEYTGEAQTRCIKTLLELQQDTISRLEERLKIQEGTVKELKDRLDRQAELAQRETESPNYDLRFPPPAYSPFYTPYSGYAPLTPPLGIYFGTPWRYSRPYLGYGSRFWGRPGLSFNFRFGGGHRHRHRHRHR